MLCLALHSKLEIGMNNAGVHPQEAPLSSSSWKVFEKGKGWFYISTWLTLPWMLRPFSTEGKALVRESPPPRNPVAGTSHGIVAGMFRQWTGPPRSSTGLPEWPTGERLAISPAQKLSGCGRRPKAEVTNHCGAATPPPQTV